MPRGAPDYSNVTTVAPLHRVTDLSELAARMESPVSFDRAGNVIFMDTFEYGLSGWDQFPTGLDGYIGISAVAHRTGSFSMILVPCKTPSRRIMARRRDVYPLPTKVGVEFSFTVTDATDYIVFEMSVYDTEDRHIAAVTYNHVNAQIIYADDEDRPVVLDTIDRLTVGYPTFHIIKFVVDMEADTYSRIILDRHAYEGLDYAIYKDGVGGDPHIYTNIDVHATDDSLPEHYMDDFILTQNEP